MQPHDVRVDHLPAEGATFDVRLDGSAATGLLRDRGLPEPLQALELTARIRVIPGGGGDVFVLGELRGSLLGPCSRCLEICEQPLGGEFHLTFVPEDAAGDGGEMELHRGDMDLELLQGGNIDLEQVVVEQLFLQLPAHAVCGEDCKGLCPLCGGNRNQVSCQCGDSAPDSRFAALSALRRRGADTDD